MRRRGKCNAWGLCCVVGGAIIVLCSMPCWFFLTTVGICLICVGVYALIA